MARLSIPAGTGPKARHYSHGYAQGWKDALEAAASLIQPIPHREEERDCGEVAEELRKLSLTPWPEDPELGWK